MLSRKDGQKVDGEKLRGGEPKKLRKGLVLKGSTRLRCGKVVSLKHVNSPASCYVEHFPEKPTEVFAVDEASSTKGSQLESLTSESSLWCGKKIILQKERQEVERKEESNNQVK